MKVSKLGELGLVDLMAKMVNSSRDDSAPSWQQLKIGIGDDTAIWDCKAAIQLATVDSLVQDVHFRLKDTRWEDLGWKALAINLSDIAAMGGIPRYALVSLTLPPDTDVEDVASLYRGMIELAKNTGVAVIGGDTDGAPTLSVSVTILGSMHNTKTVLTRSTARVGEQIAVTGYLGTATAGFEMLDKKVKLDRKSTAALKQAFLRPTPRLAEGRLLLDSDIKTAIDISDGLVSDLTHICRASNVGAKINVDRIPIHPVVEANFGKRALELALSGGEDYELLFAGSAKAIASVKKVADCPITVIGEITAATDVKELVVIADSKGNQVKHKKSGWEHFKTK